jgi:hypothetical protein
MKLKVLFFPTVFVLAFSFFISCKKGSSTASNPYKLKMYIEEVINPPQDQTDSFTLTYDANNRITGLNSALLSEIYTYGSNQSYTLDLYTNGTLSIHEIFYINNSSVVDSTLQYDNTNDTTTEGYLYSGSQLTRKSTYSFSQSTGSQIYMQEDYTYDNNGNLLKDVLSDGYGNVSTISTYTYTAYHYNNLTGVIYLPVQAKNLPATETQTDGSGNPLASLTYTYVFDGSGRVTKETDAANNGQSVIKSYIYY